MDDPSPKYLTSITMIGCHDGDFSSPTPSYGCCRGNADQGRSLDGENSSMEKLALLYCRFNMDDTAVPVYLP
ncbi:hypothetical protein J6590_047033, partial [Homalodisca vitripennis]